MNGAVRLSSIAALLLGFLSPTADAARVDPVSELEELPAKADEAELWDIASRHENDLRNSGRMVHDRHVEAYLESITDRMLGSSLDHLGMHLDFILVREPTLGGWVYPYGTIAVHTGLLAGMENEAQLGAILAHEISHFLQRHSYRELITEGRQSVIGKGIGLLATVAMASQTGVIDTDLIGSTEGLWSGLVTNGYSRKLEYVADEEGLVLMAKANYSRDQALLGFQALGDNSFYGVANPARLWSSHPKLDDRIKNLKKEIKRERKRSKQGVQAWGGSSVGVLLSRHRARLAHQRPTRHPGAAVCPGACGPDEVHLGEAGGSGGRVPDRGDVSQGGARRARLLPAYGSLPESAGEGLRLRARLQGTRDGPS